MSSYTVALIQKEEIAHETYAFTFEKPEGFTYKAGQFIDVTLIEPPETDAEGNTRAFSLVSTPDETTLKIATRIRDTAFKRVLQTLVPGATVSIAGPFGSFTLHNNEARTAVFLIGGIGITPIYSMIADATTQKKSHSLCLFYSNRTPDGSPLLTELQHLAKENQNFTLVPTMTDAPKDTWHGETGYITKEMIAPHIAHFTNPLYYLAGPAPMVKAMRTLLNEMNVDDDDIRTEEFSGY